jgi:hydrogenase/urease accessory protein HupE
MRTAYFELTESAPGAGSVTLRLPLRDDGVRITVEGCALAPTGGDPLGNLTTFSFHCEGGLAGHTVRAVGLGPIVTEAVVRAAFLDGTVRSGVVREGLGTLELRGSDSPLSVARDYLRLGVVHIATGFDHLLFLLALVLQLRRVRAVLLAESAFTISHTISFSLTALGVVRLSPVAAEACIALSLILLARELVMRREVSARRGAIVALLFGLVHGLGFAGGLREIGLPEHDVGYALLGFGGGVEVGQVAFLALVLGILRLRAVAARRDKLALGGGYAIGIVGAFWFCVRLVTLLGTT